VLYLAGVVATLSAVGCAAILGGGSKQKIQISSTPDQATFRVVSNLDVEAASGKTPQTVTLERKKEYVVEIKLAGYKDAKVPLERGTNGWIWGNLLCGGLVGIIVDFTTGAAYKLEPDQVHLELLSAQYGNGLTEMYAVLTRVDEQGELRILPVPLIPESGLVNAAGGD
jgi:hypothetical protein